MPYFQMQSTKIPSAVCKEIERIQRDFIWGDHDGIRRNHLINWKTITLPKSAGGLGFKKLELMNDAFMAKMAWEVFNDKDQLWIQALKAKYAADNRGSLCFVQKSGVSILWRNVCRMWCSLNEFLGWSLGDVSLILLILISIRICSAVSSKNSAHNTFVHCLVNYSEPSHPITSAIFTPNNSSFSSVLQAYIRNLRFNTSTTLKPFLIVTASHVSHVQAAIICAQKHNLLMKIRSGGHDYEGVSYVAEVPFFILDMFNLRAIDVNVCNETASVQAGATLGEVYYRIAEKSKIHAFPAGVCPTVGVGGHVSGGGYGNLIRKYGLSVDNVIDAEVVDVHGRLLDRKSMGEDLFWAIRGGGGASFGVVFSYKFKLVRVPEIVTVFEVRRTLEQNATDIVYKWQHVAPKIDNDLFIRLILDVVNGTQNGTKTVRATFIALFLGDSKRLLTLMNESFPELGLKQSDCIETSWLQSVLFWTNIDIATPIEILLDRQPQSLNYLKRKSDYVKKVISKEGLEGIWKKMIKLVGAILYFNPYGGIMDEVSSTATPFPHRAGNLWKIQYQANWNQAGKEVADHYISLTRKLHKYMTPYVSKNPRQAFLNYKDLDLGINNNGKNSYSEGRVFGVEYFTENFNRLVRIKTLVDPGNFFRSEQSIPTLPFRKWWNHGGAMRGNCPPLILSNLYLRLYSDFKEM
ncbi:berberine bridge enzyme-like 8 [Gastrolobium bilobum]|uniref:berberine bridge enzyme-like 8 n=1 Tax=Gastrolobium bilobum TaxID=150636 RepID=UPI002AB2AA63|nr:berberine bridge enzyme-like 8 [Gastrolobium bilobum]